MGAWFEGSKDEMNTLLFLGICMGTGGLVRCLLKNFTIGSLRFPFAAVLLTLGNIVGIIALALNNIQDIMVYIDIFNAFDLIYLLFPPLIFKTAFQVDIHIFLKSFTQILTISTLGFMFSCFVTGFFIVYTIGNEWSIVSAILFGLVVSTTDTNDTNEFLGQFKNLGVLLAGEEMIASSLSMFLYDFLVHLNDGPLKSDQVMCAMNKNKTSTALAILITYTYRVVFMGTVETSCSSKVIHYLGKENKLLNENKPKTSESQTGNSVISIVILKVAVPVATGLIVGKLFVCFISWDRCDFYTNVTSSLFVSYSMIYLVEVFVGASGILTLLVFGIIICCNKQKIGADLEHSLVQFWELIYSLFSFVLYIEAGIHLVLACKSYGEQSDIVRIFITYFICLITRSLMLLILSPILTRIGYGFNWKNGVVIVWGAFKGSATVLLASCMHLDPVLPDEFSNKVMLYAVGVVLMHIIINGTTLKKVVKVVGFADVSLMKISNMNNIMMYIMTARDRSINVLKMNRLFADASWDTVRSATKIIHPYKESFKEEGDINEGEENGLHYSKCPDCKKEVPFQPTPKELQEIKREVYLRILKAKKVSYWRQFEWGMMSKEANRTLVGTVDDALEKNMGMADVDALRNLWKPKGCAVYLRNKLVKFMPKNYMNSQLKMPLKRWQMKIYKIVSSLWWECAIFLLIILNIISIILDYIYRPDFEKIPEMALIVISTVFFVLLILQVLLKVVGVGCSNFMRSVWDFMDMLTIVITFFYIFYVYKFRMVDTDKEATHLIIMCLSGCRGIYAIRFLRLCYVVRASIPKLVEYLDRKIDVQLAHGYDVGKGFVTGENEVLQLLPRFVADKNVMAEIKMKIEADRLAITKEIGILQRNRPSIAITVKTREAMGAVLHVMKEAAKELKDGGLLDDEEYSLLCKAIEERQKYIRKHYLSVSPCPPDILFRQVSWLLDDEETATFLLTHSLIVNLNFEEILIRAEEEPQGIYVLVSGLVRMTYVPQIEKLESLEKCGALPNVDYPIGMNYRENQEDYIASGNVVGEIGILTGRTYDASITCESSVQAYFISIEIMKYAMKSLTDGYSRLEQSIWKAVSIRLACIILPAVPAYQSWTQEKIQIHLERAFVPKLNSTKTFILSDAMEAVLLIEGRALDIINKDIYFAPSYIPRTVRKLSFATNSSNNECRVEPILLVIPAEDIDEQELMEFIEGENDLSSTAFQMRSTGLNSRTLWGKSKKIIKRNMLRFNKLDMYNAGVRAIRAESTSKSDVNETSLDFPGGKNDGNEENGHVEEVKDKEGDTREEGYKAREDSDYSQEYKGRKEQETEKEEIVPEKGSLKQFQSENSDEDGDRKLYSLSYFNYKPLYDTDFEEMYSSVALMSSEETDVSSTIDENVQSNAHTRTDKSDIETNAESGVETVTETEGNISSENNEEDANVSSSNEHGFRSLRNRMRRWFN